MSKYREYVGIDISKDYFDVSFHSGQHKQFMNSVKGFKMLIKQLPDNAHCVMEQTGPYHHQLAVYLIENGLAVSVVNALTIKRFIQMRLKTTKTDKADAEMIRFYGIWDNPQAWEPPSSFIIQCKELRQLVALLLKQSTALKNQKHSMERSGVVSSLALRVIKKKLKAIKIEIKQIEAEMEALICENQRDLLSRVCSIPGVGRKTAMALIVATNGFRDFESSKQLSSFLGLSPTIRHSGSSIRGRSRISKTGNKDVRNLLFMCSFTAYKHNKACSELYHRIVMKGKSPKLALIAVCNKLLKQIFAIAKSGLIYDQEYRSKNPLLG